jgi:hypothetical protein
MRRDVEKKLKRIKASANKKEILDDVDKLQLCKSEIVFRSASSLFLKKWSKMEKEFTDYFENEWLKILDPWYEGYSIFTPSTNNSLEAANKVIKDMNIHLENDVH